MVNDLTMRNINEDRHLSAAPFSVLTPTNFNEGIQFCNIVASTKMWGVQTMEDAFVRLAMGTELGFSPMQSMRLIYSFKGNGALYASAMMALCISKPEVCEYFEPVEVTDKLATYKTKRRGHVEQTLTFTIEQARQAGYDKSNSKYITEPELMLPSRAISRLCRRVYPDILAGLYTPEELAEDPDLQAKSFTITPEAKAALEFAGQGQNEKGRAMLEQQQEEAKQEAIKTPPVEAIDYAKQVKIIGKELWPTDTKESYTAFVALRELSGTEDIYRALKDELERRSAKPVVVAEAHEQPTLATEEEDPFEGTPFADSRTGAAA